MRTWRAKSSARLDLVERAERVATTPSAAPSKPDDQAFRRAWARFEQQSASPVQLASCCG
jgi:hypothetical protein